MTITAVPDSWTALDPRVRNGIRRVDSQALDLIAYRLQERLSRDVFYARISHVEDVALDGWVYDLAIAEHHNFFAGGMLAHNTISSGRALFQRAATTKRLRALIVAEGRLLGQWRDELTRGAPGRGLPPLAPNVQVLVLDERRAITAQIRAFDRALGDRGGVVLAGNGVLDR